MTMRLQSIYYVRALIADMKRQIAFCDGNWKAIVEIPFEVNAENLSITVKDNSITISYRIKTHPNAVRETKSWSKIFRIPSDLDIGSLKVQLQSNIVTCKGRRKQKCIL